MLLFYCWNHINMTDKLFAEVAGAPEDPILGVGQQYKADPRAEKVNLSVGVYQTEEGKIPVLRAVREAETRLYNAAAPHGYGQISGNPALGAFVQELLFGKDSEVVRSRRACTVQSLGGTGGDEGGAVVRRVGVVGAGHLLHWREHAGRFISVLADNRQAADTLAVQAEGLGEGGGNEEADAGFSKEPDRESVFLETAVKALVGDIEERNEAAVDHDLEDFLPLVSREVEAGRVVAAGVQNDDSADFLRAEVSEQLLKGDRAVSLVVVLIVGNVETSLLEDGVMVAPGRNGGRGLGLADNKVEEVSGELDSAGAAE